MIIFTILLWTLLDYDQDFERYTEQIPETDLSFDMIPIEGGTFMMGSTDDEPDRKDDEGPIHEVSADGFWISEYEVTWDIYDQFVNFDKSQQQYTNDLESLSISIDGISGATPPYVDFSYGMGKGIHPATSMTQYAAISFCKWLSAKTGHFYRLPTEAEWEYACKMGLQKMEEANLDDIAWHRLTTTKGYNEVGNKKPDGNGVYDMLGNVGEWTLDQYTPNYNEMDTNNPWAFPTELYPRVLKGGSWKDAPSKCRCAARRGSRAKWKQSDPQLPKSRWWHTSAPFVGIRLVRPQVTPSPEEIKKYWLEPIDDY